MDIESVTNGKQNDTQPDQPKVSADLVDVDATSDPRECFSEY